MPVEGRKKEQAKGKERKKEICRTSPRTASMSCPLKRSGCH